jgi:hypothetical protein
MAMIQQRLLTLLIAGVLVFGPAPIDVAHAQSEVAEPFRAYYEQHQGVRILGHPLTGLVQTNGGPAQYFEKGRIEDHSGQVANPNWALRYGRLTAELMERDPQALISNTNMSYGDLADALRTTQLLPLHPIEIPAAGAIVTLPLHILAHLGQPGEQLIARVRWSNGTELTRIMPVLRDKDWGGLVVGNLAWTTESQPPQPADRNATFDLRNSFGHVLAQRPIQVLRWDDPETQPIELAWVLGDQIAVETRRVPKTVRIGTAALEELLWGPRPGDLAGFTTAIPTPDEVLRYPGRAADWGSRVTLRSLTIDTGVALADFSPELRAYGGGAARAQLIREQITHTLLQFPTVREVRIAIDGQSEGVLQP